MSYERELQFMKETALATGEILMKHFGNIDLGKPRDAVIGLLSEADKEAGEYIHRTIEHTFPGCGILSEESESKGGENTFIADPKDGTTNFVHGIPDFVIYLAYAEGKLPVAAIAYDPVNQKLFRAVKGEGAYCNDLPIHVSNRNVREALIILANDYLFPKLRERGLRLVRFLTDDIDEKYQRTFRQRVAEGGNRLCYVAMGAYDAFVGESMKPWDVVVGGLLIPEAGGKATDFEGNTYTLDTKNVLFTNGIVHDDMRVYTILGRYS